MQTAYLISRPFGAGKPTCVRKLAAGKNALRFAIDEWMHGLYGDDRTGKPGHGITGGMDHG